MSYSNSSHHEDPPSTSSDSDALVVFNYATASLNDSLSLPYRDFTFYSTSIRIKQQWTAGGKGGSEIGFGCSVYSCSFVLAHYVEMNPDIISGMHCLELGCGPGLTSIAVGLAGVAKSMTATDGDGISVQLASQNIALNLPKSTTRETTVSAKKLLWADMEDISQFEAGSIDCILCADVVAVPYESAYDALLETLDHLLTSSTSGRIYLCYQQRHITEQKFFRRFKRMFHVEQVPTAKLHSDFHNTLIPIQLFVASRR